MKRIIFFGAVFLTGALLADMFWFERYFFKTKILSLGNDTSDDDPMNILFITDLHLKERIHFKHKRVARKIEKLNPDLIVMSGDLLDSHGKCIVLRDFLALLPQSIRKLAIPGNHDHKSEASLEDISMVLEEHNGRLLLNESEKIAFKDKILVVSGLDDMIEGEGDVKKAVKETGGFEHHIMLIHSPLQQEQVKKELEEINNGRQEEDKVNIEYIFAGHTHGGQIKLSDDPFVLPAQSGTYNYGWYNKEKPCLYVSQGFGTSTVPIRLGSRAEIVFIKYYF